MPSEHPIPGKVTLCAQVHLTRSLWFLRPAGCTGRFRTTQLLEHRERALSASQPPSAAVPVAIPVTLRVPVSALPLSRDP